MIETDALFTIERDFAAPPERVWDAWTKPELLARWFGPKGTTATVLSCDLRPGGLFHARMEMPGMPAGWARFTYREIDPFHRLVWEHGFADADGDWARAPFPGPWPLRLLTEVTFEATHAGTRMTLRWSPLDASVEEAEAFVAMEPSMQGGWSGSFEALDQLLSA